MKGIFHKIAHRTSIIVGSPVAFILALLVVLAWAVAGPYFGYSDTWQLVINTGTTVLTFLIIFLVQNTQNRDAQAMNLKLDELIRAMKGARNQLLDLEDLSDEKMEELQIQFQKLREKSELMRKKKEEKTSVTP